MNNDNQNFVLNSLDGEAKVAFLEQIWNTTSDQMCLSQMIYDDAGIPVNYVILDVNPAFEKQLGFARDKAINRKVTELFPHYDLAFIEKCGEAVRSGNSLTSVEHIPEAYKSYEVQVFPLGSGGQFITMAKDITERGKLEEEQCTTEENYQPHPAQSFEDKYNLVVDSIDQGFFIIDVIFDDNGKPIDMYYVESNRAATEMLGMDFTGHRLRDIDPNYEEYWYEISGNVALTGQSIRMEQYAEPDKKWYSFNIFKIGDQNSRRIGNIFLDITESKRTKDALRESEGLFRTLFENTEDGFVLVQPIFDESGYSDNYLMVNMNQAWAEQTGLNVDDFIGKTIKESMPGVESSWPEAFAKVAKSGESIRFESFNHISDRWYDIYAFNYQDGLVGVLFRDISERRKAEEERDRLFLEAEKQRRYLLSILEQLPVGVAVFDKDGKPSLKNELMDLYMPQMIPSKDSRGIKQWRAFDTEGNEIPPDQWPGARALRGDAVVPGIDLTYTERDGQERWITVSAVPLLSKEGEIIGGTSVANDITERKRAEEEVRKARDLLEIRVEERTRELANERQRLFDVLETLPINICLLTPDYHVPFANRAYRERNGEPNNRPCYEFLFGRNQPCESCQALRPLETGEPVNWLFEAPDGSNFNVYNFPFTDVDGSSLILEMNIDITEQIRTETEMARLDRLNLIGEMAASIGHEIRNPMTAVRGFLQMLGDKKEYQYDREYFDIMIEEMDRANQIITQYLGMAKNKIVNLQLQSLDKGIKAMYPIIQSEGNLREMRIKLDLGNPTEVLLDENEMRQLILNMCRNAMEAMSSHGTLTIGTRQEGNEVILYIKDEGSGLSSEIMDKIGTPFLTTKENGTGLGLAVCYSIAARHHAKLDYETGPSGTTFYVRFPINGEQSPTEMEKNGGGGGG